MRHRALFAFLTIVSVACGDFCNCNDPTLCFTSSEEDSLVFAYNFLPSTPTTTNELTGTSANLTFEGVAGDIFDTYGDLRDTLNWIPGGGISLTSDTSGGFDETRDFTARMIGDGNEIEARLQERVTRSSFTFEAWFTRTRGYDDGVNGAGRRIFAFAGTRTPSQETGAVAQNGLVMMEEDVVEARFPVTDQGVRRNVRLNMVDVLPTTLPNEPEHIVFVIDLDNVGFIQWDIGATHDVTNLTASEVQVYYNGQQIEGNIFSGGTGVNANKTETIPAWNAVEDTRTLGVIAPGWERTESTVNPNLGAFWPRQFGGDLFWIAMYDRPLSAAEALHHYNIGHQVKSGGCGSDDVDADVDSGESDGSEGSFAWIPVVAGLSVAALLVGEAIVAKRGGGSGGKGTSRAPLNEEGRKGSPRKGSPRKGSPRKDRQQPRPVSEMSVQTTASSVMPRVRRNPDGSFA